MRSFVSRSLEIFPSRRVIDHMLGVLRSLTSIFCGDGRLNSDRRRIWNGTGRPRRSGGVVTTDKTEAALDALAIKGGELSSQQTIPVCLRFRFIPNRRKIHLLCRLYDNRVWMILFYRAPPKKYLTRFCEWHFLLSCTAAWEVCIRGCVAGTNATQQEAVPGKLSLVVPCACELRP